MRRVRDVLDSAMLTNGRHVREFEAEVAGFLGVGHAVAVSNCTVGLMLLLRCLGLRGSVVLPSFTFMATAHAVAWNRLGIRFVDVDAATWTVDPDSAAAGAVGAAGDAVAAVLAVHTFGAPCAVPPLSAVAVRHRVPLLFDAAHGFGAKYPDGTAVGTGGTAEVFSLSPTKQLSAGEGGLVTTNDGDLARELRVAREYGNPGDYDSAFVGLNARLPELSALLGRASLAEFPQWLERRRATALRYRANLADVPGVTFQQVPEGALSSAKDLTIRIDESHFGMSRDRLAACLSAERVATRCYFYPPVHRQRAYRQVTPSVSLPETETLAASVLTLPLYSHLSADVVDRICEAIRTIQQAADLIGESAPVGIGAPDPTNL
nr:DegT/DnrJ/EryC1/StrS family aminotransferase [Planosporangium thailandense]